MMKTFKIITVRAPASTGRLVGLGSDLRPAPRTRWFLKDAAKLGFSVSVAAGLLVGGATAQEQLIGKPRIPGAPQALQTAPLPELESVLAQGQGEGCDSSEGSVFVAGGAGYQKPVDILPALKSRDSRYLAIPVPP